MRRDDTYDLFLTHHHLKSAVVDSARKNIVFRLCKQLTLLLVKSERDNASFASV
jgi:hypothetical protein